MTKTTKAVLWIIGAVVVIGGIYFAVTYKPVTPADTDNIPAGTICTMDAKLCPDGSYVGRSGPNCEFVCPTGTSNNSGVPVVNGAVDANGTVYPADQGK